MRIVFAAALVLLAQAASAHGPGREQRYRIEEIKPPAAMTQDCVDGVRVYSQGVSINDLGVVAANFNCYTQFDPPALIAITQGGAYLWSSWFGAVAREPSEPGQSAFANSANLRGDTFGGEFRTNAGLVGVRWPLGGGIETLFTDPSCGGLNINGAVTGNGRYTIGWGWRTDPSLPGPADTICLQSWWLIKTPSGAVIRGPIGDPRDLNELNVAVGLSNDSAIRYNVVNGQSRVLRAGTPASRAISNDINDLGEVAGHVSTRSATDPDACPSSIALKWDRNDREIPLPPLPGDVSARAWAVGYNGETLGESGPGEYCEPQISENETAVIWRGNRATDLNGAIPPAARVQLVTAIATNRRGQILAYGHRPDDALVICPRTRYDPETGSPFIDTSWLCRRGRTYVLTPVDR